jgi:hypothetical protein
MVSDGRTAAPIGALLLMAEHHTMAGLKVAWASITSIDYNASTGTHMACFQSFKKPAMGLETGKDGANQQSVKILSSIMASAVLPPAQQVLITSCGYQPYSEIVIFHYFQCFFIV